MLKISAAAREMKDRVKGGEGGGGKEREEVRQTQRDKEKTPMGGGAGLRGENARPQFTVLGQAGLGLGLVSIKMEIESEKEKSYFFTLNSEKWTDLVIRIRKQPH